MNDARMWIGALFIFGYYVIVIVLAFQGVPEKNGNLINNALLQLGPPVGLIIGALFRTDKTDETRAANTGKALDAINTAQAANAPPVTTTTTTTVEPGPVVTATPGTPAGTTEDPLIVAGAPAGTPPVQTTPARKA